MKKCKEINYIHFDVIDSTNTWTKKNAHALDLDGITCVTARQQTAGRGRWQRKWISPKEGNIYATLFFCLPKECSYLGNLGQILSISCAHVLEEMGFSPQIKWPNDLLLSGKKVAGILCETVPFEERLGIALGIGLNVNMSQEMLRTVDQPAISLAQLSGQTWTVEQILNPLVQQFLKDLSLLQKEGFKPFCKIYERFLAYRGEEISCFDGVQRVHGICHSVDERGKLRLVLPSDEVLELSAGEVKLPGQA